MARRRYRIIERIDIDRDAFQHLSAAQGSELLHGLPRKATEEIHAQSAQESQRRIVGHEALGITANRTSDGKEADSSAGLKEVEAQTDAPAPASAQAEINQPASPSNATGG